MGKFLLKEIKLCLNPVNYLFFALVLMFLIPNYPCYVPFFYICLGIFFIFNNGEINRDIQYSLILPITKADIVKSRCVIVAVYEIVAVLVSIPIAFLMNRIFPQGNLAGINANVAFYGLLLIEMTVFNFIMFRSFYKKGEKPGFPFFYGAIAYWIIYLLLESPVWVKNMFNLKYVQIMDSNRPEDMIQQIPVLAVGIVVYILGWIVTYKVAARKFEKVDL